MWACRCGADLDCQLARAAVPGLLAADCHLLSPTSGVGLASACRRLSLSGPDLGLPKRPAKHVIDLAKMPKLDGIDHPTGISVFTGCR